VPGQGMMQTSARRARRGARRDHGTLLCVSNYAANTGYAWTFIEGLYARIADHLAEHGIRTLVAYPAIPEPPRTLAGTAAQAVTLDASLSTPASVRAVLDLIRREHVRVVYLTDRDPRCLAYPWLRRAGVSRIIVHDHTSGERTSPRGLKRAAKWTLARVPGLVADVVVTVSDFVAGRQRDVNLIPLSKLARVWNGLPAVTDARPASGYAHDVFGLPKDRPLIVCVCRASGEKGVAHLLRAFDRARGRATFAATRPLLLYAGDGPQLPALRQLRDALAARDDITLAGYRRDVAEIIGSADLCVMPSVWQDAFPLAVLEPMAQGKTVIASRVGGIPEQIKHGVSGLLVPPGDEAALADAMAGVLADPAWAARLGKAARERIASHFAIDTQVRRLSRFVEDGFGLDCPWSLAE
jgi:glycosyltransferase involved in cell wall biosynthesis